MELFILIFWGAISGHWLHLPSKVLRRIVAALYSLKFIQGSSAGVGTLPRQLLAAVRGPGLLHAKLPLGVLGLIVTLFSACETDIDLSIPINESSLVVDGYIINGEPARVAVTTAYPYTSVIDLESLSEIVIPDAIVLLSDGQLTDTLRYTVDLTQFPPFFYQGQNPALFGQEGKTYTIQVIVGEDTATASTYIPTVVPLDSLAWESEGKDELDTNIEYGRLRVWFRDPPELGNHYRIFLKNQDFSAFQAPFNSVFEDRIINGDSIFFDVSKPDAVPTFLVPDSLSFQERRRFIKGDTIDVRFCSITRESYTFIRSFQTAAGSFGNPFAAPTFVKGNMKGALGGFVGYGASYHTFISQ
ncbi:MAG: DUF4249 domain-containing protein [Bacteroidetes bacterium]|nr:DUF4249 domain-containing protein [Bacteroidota bacterium]